MTRFFRAEPVLALLNGIAAVVNLVLIAIVVLDVVDLDGDQIAALVAAVQGTANLLAVVVRSAVYSPATVDAIKRAAVRPDAA